MEYFSLDSGIWDWLFSVVQSIKLKGVFGIILPLLNGWAIIHYLGHKLSSGIKTAVIAPLGFGSVGIVLFVLLNLGIDVTYNIVILIVGLITITLSIIPTIKYIGKLKYEKINFKWNFRQIIKPKNIDLLYVSAFIFVLYISISTIIKTLYWPVFDWDAITTFDFYGVSIYRENTMIPTTLKYNLLGSGVAYPPLTHLLIAYSYIIGFSTPKIIYALVFVSTIIGLYSLLRVEVHKAASMLAVLLLVSTPEFLAFSSMVKTNSLQVMYITIGITGFIQFYNQKKKSYLYLAIAMIMLNAWVRSEGIETIMVLSILLFVMWLKKQTSLKNVLLFVIITPILFISWQVFLKVNTEYFSSYIQVSLIKYPFWDSEKLSIILSKTAYLFLNKTYFGFTFVITIIVFLLNTVIYRKNGNYLSFGIIIALIIVHIVLLYQLHYKQNNMEWLLTHSYKRYIFNYIPLACYFIFSTNTVKYIFNKYEQLIFTKMPKENQITKSSKNRRNPKCILVNTNN